jgi:RimJ/RimL family protein N-acetyltransferase
MSETYLHPQAEIVTPRLRLRRLRPADAGLVALYSSDPRVARMTASIPHPYPPGLAEAYIERSLSAAATETVWAMDAGEEGENGLVGVISLKRSGNDVAEVGYWVAPAFWGTGFASEAVEAIAAWADEHRTAALTAQVFQDNAASTKVLTRAGFRYEGEGEIHALARGAMVPTFRYRRELGGAGRT